MGERRITSTEIKVALSRMHNNRNTYFLTECKTCSSYFPDPQGLLIFDGLAITKSYTKPCIIGYEIKVSRGDFLRDAKWHLYLQYCNEFYFVVPKGLIRKEELPDNVGLIYYDPDAKTELHTVKKAQYRQIDDPVGVYKYIIYSRFEEDRIPFYEDRAEFARDYLEDKAYKKAIGDKLGSKMAQELQSALNRLDRLTDKEYELECWKRVQAVLDKHGIYYSWRRHYGRDATEDWGWIGRLEEALSGSVKSDDLDVIERNLQYALNAINRLKEAHADDKGGV